MLVLKVKVIPLPWTKVIPMTKLKVVFMETSWSFAKKNHVGALWNNEMKTDLIQLFHVTKMAAMPIYGKNPSKIFFS